jgi:Holliday junction DNA helicase RuvA
VTSLSFCKLCRVLDQKVALSALSIYDEAQIVAAISNEDSAGLERIPGLGKKGAQRAVLDLKDKVKGMATSATGKQSGGWRVQLHSALVGLGFAAREAEESIDLVVEEVGSAVASTPITELLKLALQNRGR